MNDHLHAKGDGSTTDPSGVKMSRKPPKFPAKTDTLLQDVTDDVCFIISTGNHC